MADLFEEVLALVEDNVKWLDDAARHFASRPGNPETCDLLAAAYEERARIHERMGERMRREGRLTMPDGKNLNADPYQDPWWALYKNAVLETNPEKLAERVRAAEEAVAKRSSRDGEVPHGEREALRDAQNALLVLRRERMRSQLSDRSQ